MALRSYKTDEQDTSFNIWLDFTTKSGKPYQVQVWYYPIGKYTVHKPDDPDYRHTTFVSNKKSIDEVVSHVKNWQKIGMLL